VETPSIQKDRGVLDFVPCFSKSKNQKIENIFLRMEKNIIQSFDLF